MARFARVAALVWRKPRATSGEPRATSRARNPDSRPSAAVCHFGSFLTPQPARLWRVPQSLFFYIPPPHWHGSCAQRRMPMRPCHKPSNSSQNRSKRRRFPSKSDQKRAHFVMPILTFWGWTPSGASARAVLASRKGKKGAFSGAPGQVPKVIHSYPQSRGSRAAVKPRRACPARVAGGGPRPGATRENGPAVTR